MPKVSRIAVMVSLNLFAPFAAGGEKGGEQVSHFYGNFSYSIPIEVPVFHGIEPRLTLSYSAGGRNGQLGVGWTLSGLSTVQLGYAFSLDGQELMACSPGLQAASCIAGGHFTTKDESYLKITTPGDGTFRVFGRDGTQTTLSPTILATSGASFRWGQTLVQDTKGNVVTYQWTPAGSDDAYPSTISYNGFSITFYRVSRADIQSFGATDHIATTSYRLSSIAVRQGHQSDPRVQARLFHEQRHWPLASHVRPAIWIRMQT